MNIKIIDEDTFSYNGHIIKTNNIKRWIDLNGHGRNIHMLGNSCQTINACLSTYFKNTISEKTIYNNINFNLKILINAGFKI